MITRRTPKGAVPQPGPGASEHIEQVFFVAWFRRTHPEVRIFAVPNGGGRSAGEGARLKAEGVSPGVPDLYVPAWACWIEMKRTDGGTVSPEQRDWLAYLQALGHTALVAHGCADAIALIEKLCGAASR